MICGAGISGLAAAWWLGRNGWQVLLVEHADLVVGIDGIHSHTRTAVFGPGAAAERYLGVRDLGG